MPINLKVALCGAKSRQHTNRTCTQPAMKGKKRCRLHGGKSTGAKTAEGRKRCAEASYKHGLYTKAAYEERKKIRMMMQWRNDLHQNKAE